MAINAGKKFKTAAVTTFFNSNLCYKFRTIDSMQEIDAIYSKGLSTLRAVDKDYKYIKSNSKITNVSARESISTYEDEIKLIFFNVNFEYDENGKKHISNQIILTKSYESLPLIFITTDYRKRAPQQLFSKSSPRDDIFEEQERNIEVQDVNIFIDGNPIGYFQTFIDGNGIMLERCIHNYLLTPADERSEFLKYCCNGAKLLEIIYSKSEPIYTQFACNHKLESIEYDPNSREDTKKIEEEINKEVAVIVSRISSIITSQNKKSKMCIKK